MFIADIESLPQQLKNQISWQFEIVKSKRNLQHPGSKGLTDILSFTDPHLAQTDTCLVIQRLPVNCAEFSFVFDLIAANGHPKQHT
jgi:hypothetical protein